MPLDRVKELYNAILAHYSAAQGLGIMVAL